MAGDARHRLFGLPVVTNLAVPRDEVWLRTKDELVRLVNLAYGEPEVERLRRENERLRARLARVMDWASAPDVLGWRGDDIHRYRRGRVWSGRRARRTTRGG